jgi:hypothetical protein
MFAIREYIEYKRLEKTKRTAPELKISRRHFEQAVALMQAQSIR